MSQDHNRSMSISSAIASSRRPSYKHISLASAIAAAQPSLAASRSSLPHGLPHPPSHAAGLRRLSTGAPRHPAKQPAHLARRVAGRRAAPPDLRELPHAMSSGDKTEPGEGTVGVTRRHRSASRR